MVNGIYAFKGQGPHFPRKYSFIVIKRFSSSKVLAHLIQTE